MTEHISITDRAEMGRRARAQAPRSSHGEFTPSPDRPDPVDLLLEQAESRVQDLIPIRHERMLQSAFAFYRGGAAIMAADLANTPSSGFRVQCCGDAHLANFGGFESPERTMVFDINDFDETTPGPWEWDVKRLAASFVIAAHDREFDDAIAREAVAATVRTYREAMREFAEKSNLDVWYSRLDVQGILARWGAATDSKTMRKFERTASAPVKNNLRAMKKLTTRVGGEIRIDNDPPLLVRVHDLFSDEMLGDVDERVRGLIANYSRTLQHDRRMLLESYRFVDMARKVVGVGSVGTRCWIILLLGDDDNDPLFLQAKEAQTSVLEPYVGTSEYELHGQRVVEGQRLMQAASDIFLGWEHAVGFDDVPRDYYVRQLWDGKLSADLAAITPTQLPIYGEMCGWTLARAHARSGDRFAISAYLGTGEVFDRAIADFSFAYAEQNVRDYETVMKAAKEGRIEVGNNDPKTAGAAK